MTQNIGNLTHFHHKGTLPAGQIIRCTHAGKNPIYNTDICTVCRNKASHLSHQHNEGGLSHIGRFTCHVRSGNNGDTVGSVVQISIIGNEHIIGDHILHYRMTASADINNTAGIDLRAHITVFICHISKRSKDIKLRHCLRCLLNT